MLTLDGIEAALEDVAEDDPPILLSLMGAAAATAALLAASEALIISNCAAAAAKLLLPVASSEPFPGNSPSSRGLPSWSMILHSRVLFLFQCEGIQRSGH